MKGLSLIFQTSAGGVVFRKHNRRKEIVLVTLKNGTVWCLPKGLVNEGETPEITALREVEEETGIKAKIIDKLGEISYWYYMKEENARCKKTVHFYLMECINGDTSKHDWEVESVQWLPIEEAMKKATYKGEKEIIKSAIKKLKIFKNGSYNG